MLRTTGYTSANRAAFANADPHMDTAAEGRPTTRSSTPGSVPRTQTHRKRSSKPIFLPDGVFVSTTTVHEQSKQTYYQSTPSLTQFRFHLLKAIVSARIMRLVSRIRMNRDRLRINPTNEQKPYRRTNEWYISKSKGNDDRREDHHPSIRRGREGS